MASEQSLFDALALETMASGHLCLNLSERVAWDEFSAFATDLIKRVGGQVRGGAEGAEMRVWEVELMDTKVSLVWDDYPAMVSLEARDSEGDAALRAVFALLSRESR